MRSTVVISTKVLFIILYLLISSNLIFANGYSNNGIVVLRSNTNELVIRYSPIIKEFKQIQCLTGETTILPSIEGATFESNNSGEPATLVVSTNITVPDVNAFDFEILNIHTTSKPGTIVPCPTLVRYNETSDEEYSIDKDKYNNYKSKKFAELNYVGIGRDRHIARLTFRVAQYNPISNSIDIPDVIEIRVKFKPVNTTTFSGNSKSDYDPTSSINHYESATWRISKDPIAITKENNPKIQTAEDREWFKLAIQSEGLYIITPNMLASAGISLTKADIPTIKIYGNGGVELSELVSDGVKNSLNEQEIIVRTNQNGDLESIIFYAGGPSGFRYDSLRKKYKHYLNHYSTTNYYLLTFGGADGKRAKPIIPPANDIVSRPQSYYHRIFFEEELTNAFREGSGRYWFGRTFFPTSFTNILPDLDRSKSILYNFSNAQRANNYGNMTIFESSVQLCNMELSAVNTEDASRSETSVWYPASNIPADNRSTLKYEYKNTNSIGGIAMFDWYEIHFPRLFVPINNELTFFTDSSNRDCTEFSINNFTSNDIVGFDITDIANPHQLQNTATTGKMFNFKDSLNPSIIKKYYISASFNQPRFEKIPWKNFRNNHANKDIIVITHPDLIEAANKYADYRNTQGELTAAVFSTTDIFNEFASGVPDPTAMRDFIANAMANWENKPKYVLLFGDGHYDYKNLETKNTNFVPPYETEDNVLLYNTTSSYTTDDFFAKVVGDDYLVDLAIGRLCADSPGRANWLVDKIKLYENSSNDDNWRITTTFLADDSPASQNPPVFDLNGHTSQSEQEAALVPGDFKQNKIYLVEYPTETIVGGRRKPRATEDMLTTINTSGTLILSWVGHGNPRVWAHEEVLERSITIPQMLNLDKLFFCTVASCDYGRFDLTEIKSGTEDMVNSKTGGAIAVLAASRVVYAGDNATFHNELYKNMFIRDSITGKYPRIGDFIYTTKQLCFSENDQKFNLIGDPALRLLIPDYVTRIDSINGTSIACDTCSVELKALSKVKISGSVGRFNSNETDKSFNGTASVTMLDCDQNITAIDVDNSIHHILKQGGALNRSSYKVINGTFNSDFIIPKDISFSSDRGRLFTYAFSDDKRYAKGSTRKFILGGIETVGISDYKGPDINIFLDSRKFISNDLVRAIPLLIVDLFDESGVNTTGIGIGHKIEAWIDDNPISLDLTNEFNSSLENPRAGSAQKYLGGLQQGTHKIKVRAWDVYNNFSTEETYFRIGNGSNSSVIWDIFNYPNPMENYTTFAFKHNMAPPYIVELTIYNSLGQRLKSLSSGFNSAQYVEMKWDGYDDKGNALSNGNYIYRVMIQTSNGQTKTSFGAFCILR